ncbi:MAG TPA: hypothetical protein VGG20_21365 [Thermoanaerobaculia bacterium]
MADKKVRKKVGLAAEADVLLRSRRRCAICFGLNRDAGIKAGQIAHLDQDPSNNDPDNLAFLCFDHHDAYDSKTRQSKNFTESEVKLYRTELGEFFGSEKFWPSPPQAGPEDTSMRSEVEISLELYDRRIAVYRILRDFLIKVLGNTRVEIEDLRRFAQETEEAIFLFDARIARYLDDVYQHAVRLRAAGQRMEHPGQIPDQEWRDAIKEDGDLLNWFSSQFTEARTLFKRYLGLGTPNMVGQADG